MCATNLHTTRKKKAAEHFDTFVSSMIAFSKSDDNSKFNEYLSSLVPVDIEKEYDKMTHFIFDPKNTKLPFSYFILMCHK